MKPKFMIIALIFLASFAVFLVYSVQLLRDRNPTISSASHGPAGFSSFLEVAQKIGHDAVGMRFRVFKSSDTIEDSELTLVVSPQRPHSVPEVDALSVYVSRGGNLFVSAHDDRSYANILPLLKVFDISQELRHSSGFVNRTATEVLGNDTEGIFSGNHTYKFYSRYVFSTEECKDNNLHCFVQRKDFGKGSVTVVLGYPPMMNALIGSLGNRALAMKILNGFTKITFEEYTGVLARASLPSLLQQPRVALPLFGLLLVATLFFFFGPLVVNDEKAIEHEFRANTSMHEDRRAAFNALVRKLGV